MIRHLLASLFLNYANFSGRSGRPEFWLFILTFTLVTQGSALIGYGIANLVTPHSPDKSAYHELEIHRNWHHGHDNDSRVTLTVHRHDHSEGFHLHGIIDPDGDEYGAGDGIKNSEGYKRWRHDDGDHHVSDKVGDTLWLLSSLLLLIPLLAIGARRLHDSNHSGWWQLMILVPVAGWIVLFVFMLLPGDDDENRYGHS